MDWSKLLEHSPSLAVALIVWFTQRDILREQQSTNRKLARIEGSRVGTPAKGVPIMRRRTKSDTDEDDAIAVARTTTDEDL